MRQELYTDRFPISEARRSSRRYWQPATGQKKALNLFKGVVATVTYLRCNDIEAVIGEWSRVSQVVREAKRSRRERAADH
jgi:hypothetical protein